MLFETKRYKCGMDGKYAGGDAQTRLYYWVIKYNENRSYNQNIKRNA
ncbi:MAG: hypothetical protein ACOYOV_15475 [Bacteroidales bacterium]